MRDGLLDLPSLGQAAGVQLLQMLKIRYICLPIYHTMISRFCQPLIEIEF